MSPSAAFDEDVVLAKAAIVSKHLTDLEEFVAAVLKATLNAGSG